MQPRRRYINNCWITSHALWVLFSLSSGSIRNIHWLLVVSSLLIRKSIAKRGICRKSQLTDIDNKIGGNHKRTEATTIDK